MNNLFFPYVRFIVSLAWEQDECGMNLNLKRRGLDYE